MFGLIGSSLIRNGIEKMYVENEIIERLRVKSSLAWYDEDWGNCDKAWERFFGSIYRLNRIFELDKPFLVLDLP